MLIPLVLLLVLIIVIMMLKDHPEYGWVYDTFSGIGSIFSWLYNTIKILFSKK
jgi:hypothetical protein